MVGVGYKEAFDSEKATMEERYFRMTLLQTYPDCLAVASVVNHKGAKKKLVLEDLSVEAFMELPEALVIEWEQAALKCNPHWIPQPPKEKDVEGEKPEPNSDAN